MSELGEQIGYDQNGFRVTGWDNSGVAASVSVGTPLPIQVIAPNQRAVDTGAVNAYLFNPPLAWGSYAAGNTVYGRISVTNTGASTGNVSSLGVKNIKTMTGAALPAGALVAGVWYAFVYDGTNLQIIE